MQALIAYVATGAIFVALDFMWLGLMTGPLYKPQLGALMRENVSLPPSILFYLVYVCVLTALVVLPALRAANPIQALVHGLLLGLAAYAAYNLTNAATLNGWPPLLTFIDWVWGTFVTGVAACLAVLALRALTASGG